MTNNQKVISGLKQALTACREKNRELKTNLDFYQRYFGEYRVRKAIVDLFSVNEKAQKLAEETIKDPGEITPTDVLTDLSTKLLEDDSTPYDNLIEACKEIDKELGEEIETFYFNINYKVVCQGDCFGASGWKVPQNQPFDIDVDEWDNEFKKPDRLYLEDEDKYDLLREAVYTFAEEIYKQVFDYLQEEGIDIDEIHQYVLPRDIKPFPVIITEVGEDDNFVKTDKGDLAWRCDYEDYWDFINKNRGALIHYSQIDNLELLPDYLKEKTVFYLE